METKGKGRRYERNKSPSNLKWHFPKINNNAGEPDMSQTFVFGQET
jgi:hypothetical protein